MASIVDTVTALEGKVVIDPITFRKLPIPFQRASAEALMVGFEKSFGIGFDTVKSRIGKDHNAKFSFLANCPVGELSECIRLRGCTNQYCRTRLNADFPSSMSPELYPHIKEAFLQLANPENAKKSFSDIEDMLAPGGELAELYTAIPDDFSSTSSGALDTLPIN